MTPPLVEMTTSYHDPPLSDASVRRNGRLPIELAEACIDMLHDDQDALYACARVCRAWLPRAYSHRFAVLRYGIDTEPPGFWPPRAVNLVCLLDYLVENRRVGSLVRELFLRARRERLQLNLLRMLLFHLPHLIVCDLDAAVQNSLTSFFTYPICTAYNPKALRVLTIRAPRTLRGHVALEELLELFSSIEDLRLSLENPRAGQGKRPRSTRRQHGLKVARLTIDGRYSQAAATAMLQLRAVLDKTSLRVLSCPAFGARAEDPSVLRLFLEDCGAGLAELDISDAARDIEGPVELHACPSIVSLHLIVPLPVGSGLHGPGFNGGWNTLCSTLWNAPPSLRRVRLALDPLGGSKGSPPGVYTRELLVALDSLDWSAVDRYLRSRGKGARHLLSLCIVNKDFDSPCTLLGVARQIVDAKLTSRVRRYVDYELVSTTSVQSIV